MTGFDKRRPRDPEAFARMLATAAAAIDRAQDRHGAGGREAVMRARAPRRPDPDAPADAGRRRGKGPEASAVWPDAARKAGKPPADAGEPANPYDLLKQASRAQERAAAQLLAARARPPRK